MSFKRFLNSHFVFGNEKHISFFQGSSFRFAVIKNAFLLNTFCVFLKKCLKNARIWKISWQYMADTS